MYVSSRVIGPLSMYVMQKLLLLLKYVYALGQFYIIIYILKVRCFSSQSPTIKTISPNANFNYVCLAVALDIVIYYAYYIGILLGFDTEPL